MALDVFDLAIIGKSLQSIAEEMGIVLQRTSYSQNIKERTDLSAAVFNSTGELIAQAHHIPVHLGAMSFSVQASLAEYTMEELEEGDVIVVNDPFLGGTHLPDITAISPVYIQRQLAYFVANRAHHSDVGGTTPGSMPGSASSIFEEGLVIPPVKLYRKGVESNDIMNLILRNVRTDWERKGDLRAQGASLEVGRRRLQELSQKQGLLTLKEAEKTLMEISEKTTREALGGIPPGSYSYEDFLDSDGIDQEPVKITVKIHFEKDDLILDFHGSSPQCKGNVNATRAVTHSAVYYAIRSIVDPDMPTNQGCFRPIQVRIPEGSVLDAKWPAAVSGGNVETSQRIVDVVYGALSIALPELIPADSQGTMNNITIGGRTDAGSFSYYETIGGGMGARPGKNGIDGIHTHMTNTRNTPVEALETTFPLRVERYELIENSGGDGQYRGGNGIRRDIKLLIDATVSVMSERRRFAPKGRTGGEDGNLGKNFLVRKGKVERLDGKTSLEGKKSDLIRICTPGGGGYGSH